MLDPKIYTLLKVAETGNYTQAGKELNITQPAVSQHIRALEREFDIKIFERLGNQLILTKEGESVVACARSMISLYNNLRTSLKDEAAGMMSLKIGVTHTVESNRLSEVFAKYASTGKGINIKLLTGTQAKLIQRLKNFELDFALIDGRINEPGLKNMQLDTDSLILVTSIDHPLAKKNTVSIDDIKHEKLILRLPDSSTANLFTASLESKNLSLRDFNVILEVDNVATIKDLVRHQYGVSILAKSACMDDIRKKRLIGLPIDNLSMVREINFVYSENFRHTDLLQEFVNLYNEI